MPKVASPSCQIQRKATIKSGTVSDAEFSEMLAQMRKWGEEYDHLRQEREEREGAPITADPSLLVQPLPMVGVPAMDGRSVTQVMAS